MGRRRSASNDRARLTAGLATPWLVLVFDTLAGGAAMYASISLRYLLEPGRTPPGPIEWYASIIFAGVCAAVFWSLRAHRAIWRYTAVNDVVRVLQGVLLAHLIFLPIFFLSTRLDDFPRSSLLISVPVMAAAQILPRLFVAAWTSGDLRSLVRFERRDQPPAVLVGNTQRVAEVLREQYRRTGGPVFRFRAVIDTGGDTAGRALQGVPVLGGTDQLERAVTLAKGSAASVRIVIADPEADPALVNLCAKVAGKTGASLTRARRGEGAAAFTQVEAADLLSRPPRSLARAGAQALVAGKRVLVTGAGGTIGGELVRHVIKSEPAELILVDCAESHLYEIDMELRAEPRDFPWQSLLVDVRNKASMRHVFETTRPQIVLHAAALKHVPLSESNPFEAARTNVIGTQTLTEAAINAKAEALVLISTDKAVDPLSVMGASKRCAEIYIASRAAQNPETRLCAVRFGNVLASNGSVVPLFERQIERGGPVTVTHEKMTRYFMTVEEAASLVLDAAAQCANGLAPQGSLFVLDMGDPVPIARLARQLIRLRGKEPGRDIEIKFIGMRPGEKMHEDLAHAFETLEPSPTAGVLRASGPITDMALLNKSLEALSEAADSRDRTVLLKALDDIVAMGLPEGVMSLAGRLSARG